jgi:hypothetical protein
VRFAARTAEGAQCVAQILSKKERKKEKERKKKKATTKSFRSVGNERGRPRLSTLA